MLCLRTHFWRTTGGRTVTLSRAIDDTLTSLFAATLEQPAGFSILTERLITKRAVQQFPDSNRVERVHELASRTPRSQL
jgi:hypothetical protein